MLLAHTFNTGNAYVLIRYSFIQSMGHTYICLKDGENLVPSNGDFKVLIY